jgi:hypothetical protein
MRATSMLQPSGMVVVMVVVVVRVVLILTAVTTNVEEAQGG